MQEDPGNSLFDRLSGSRIVMATHDFAPDSVGIAPYATETAEWLAAAGAHVDVLTMPPHYPAWRVPSGVRRGWSRESRNGVTVWRIPTYVPRNPTLARRLAFEGSWVLGALPLALSTAVRRADLVVGVHPGLFASAFAARIARSRPLVQIVQDLLGEAATQSGIHAGDRARRLLTGLEARSLRAADAITVPSHSFIGPLTGLGVSPERITVVPNWSRIQPPSGSPAAPDRSTTRGEFRLLHAGNMGLKQGLELLAPSIREAATHEPDLRFVFVGAGSQADALRAAVAGQDNARILGHVPDEEFPGVLQTADALLVHERPTVKDMCLPSKLTTYFAMGRPVIAVTREDGSTADEVRRSGAGLVVAPGDTPALLQAVRRLREDTDLARSLADNGRRYSREHLAAEVSLAAIAGLVQSLMGP